MATTTTPLNGRPSSNLRPVWAPHFNFDLPHGPPLGHTGSHIYSPSLKSPKILATPVLPSASFHDEAMRQLEQSLVARLDKRSCQSRKGSDISSAASTSVSRPLLVIDEDWAAKKSLSLSTQSTQNLVQPPPTAASPATTFPKRQTLVSEARSMLLANLGKDMERRQLVPVNKAESNKVSQPIRLKQLREWGHAYLGDTKSADVFVQAVPLRRASDVSSNCFKASNLAASLPQLQAKYIMVKARVRPRDMERNPFFIQREFEISELRSTIPDPLPNDVVPAPRAPVAAIRTPIHQSKHGHLFSHDPRRRSSIDARALMRGIKAIPIHIEYARAYVPVLAALMVSGHVHEGDVIDLPLPHPEAWSATVEYIYTGRSDLTEAVKRNISYLAGKIPLS